MKKTIISCLALLLLLISPNASVAEFVKTKIAVLDFQLQGKGFETEDMGKIVAEWLVTALVKEGRFDVIERRLLQKILQEHKLAMTGVVDETSATKLGKLLGVKVIISGSVLKLQSMIEVNARIIDVESASIMAAESVKSSEAHRLEELIVQMAEIIMKDFPLEGYIVHRLDKKVVVDLGKRYGVKPKMRFMVFKEGNVIKHPKTGEVLDVEKIQTGIIEVSNVKAKIADAVIVSEESKGAINYGQMVKSVSERLNFQSPSSSTRHFVDGMGRIFVNTDPMNCQVRILNIRPRYSRGMELDSGNYNVEVSLAGFESATKWVTVQAGEEKHVSFKLEKYSSVSGSKTSTISGNTSVSRLSPQLRGVVKMLQSSNSRSKKQGARIVYKRYLQNTALLDAVSAELLKSYKTNRDNDKYYIDALAWMCNVLGRSGKSKYKATLQKVAQNSSNRKLKKYAQKNANLLP